MKTKPARVSSPPSPAFSRRLAAWTVRPVAFVAGLVAMLWRRRGRGQAGADTATKTTRLSRRQEKRRRKELVRAAAKTHHPGRRRAA